MPEVEARAHLRGRVATFSVLAPVGSFAGKGALRVLRARAVERGVELVCGYEAYERAN